MGKIDYRQIQYDFDLPENGTDHLQIQSLEMKTRYLRFDFEVQRLDLEFDQMDHQSFVDLYLMEWLVFDYMVLILPLQKGKLH